MQMILLYTVKPQQITIYYTNPLSLLAEASKWYESCLLKLIIDETQFCNFSNQNIKDYYHVIFHNTEIESILH